MSLLHRGGTRRARGKVLATVVAVGAFQVLAIVGAGVANAATCTYNPATDTINIVLAPGDQIGIAVETTAANLDAESPAGAILFDADPLAAFDFQNGAVSTQCGSADNTNTVAIIVLGAPSANEVFTIHEAAGAPFATTIQWNIDLGSQGVAPGDTFQLLLNGTQDNSVVLTPNAFSLNGGAAGELLNAEVDNVVGGAMSDTIDGSALPATTVLTADGGAGDDWIAPGLNLLDVVTGGAGAFDAISYATRTGCVVINNTTGLAGGDTNCDGAVVAPEETDTHSLFEVLISGSGNDTIVGVGGPSEFFVGGEGDDSYTGVGGADTIDFSGATGPVVITPGAGATGTATGQGNDTGFGDSTQFIGGAGDDVVIVGSGTYPGGLLDFFSGQGGSDTVDGSAATAAVAINLELLDPDPGPEPTVDVDGYFGSDQTDDVENAIGSEFNDTLVGNSIRNTLTGLGGDDTLTGAEGNDTLLGGLGNDTFTGGAGADRVSFAGSPAGVNVDLSLGFATGEGDDGFGDLVEIIVGSGFGDTITGGPFAAGGTVNFLLIGRGGNDTLTGFAGNDTLRGGPGRDTLRGVGGDDNLVAGGGRDTLAGGGGFDIGRGGPGADVCRSVERRFSCGTPGNPARPAAQLAKLV
jgi:hypothetical protein